MTQPRLIWADSLKGWLMLLVILGHAIQGTLGYECNSNHVFNLIYSFHMPAFIAVSGWLLFRGDLSSYTKEEYLKSCKRRSLQLLIPYFVWIITHCKPRQTFCCIPITPFGFSGCSSGFLPYSDLHSW